MTAELANVYPPEIWARESLMVLSNTHVAANLVHRDFENEVAQVGDTVNTRKPEKFTVASINNTITFSMTIQQPTATNVQVVLNKHKVVPFAITGKDQDTSIKNLVEEFMEPAVVPLAQQVDDDLLSTSGGLMDSSISTTTKAGASLALVDFAQSRKKLRTQQVPMSPVGGQSRISMVMGVEHEAEALTVGELVTANQSGYDPPPVRTGFIQTIYGMNVFADQGVPNGPTSTDAGATCIFHRNAIALVTRPLEQIPGEFGIRSSVMQRDGVSLRVLQSFQHLSVRWVISLDILYGIKLLDTNLATVLQDA